MGKITTAYPELPSFIQSLSLGEEQYRMRLTWRARLGAWYADLYKLDGAPVILGQAVRSRWALGFGLNPIDAPSGVFLFSGPDEYRRKDLGNTLQLVFYSDDELPEVVEDDDGLTITV